MVNSNKHAIATLNGESVVFEIGNDGVATLTCH